MDERILIGILLGLAGSLSPVICGPWPVHDTHDEIIVIEEPPHPTCLEGLQSCRNESACNSVLDTIPKEHVCGKSSMLCPAEGRRTCMHMILYLRRHVKFKDCTCPHNINNFDKCLEMRRTILQHTCMDPNWHEKTTERLAESMESNRPIPHDSIWNLGGSTSQTSAPISSNYERSQDDEGAFSLLTELTKLSIMLEVSKIHKNSGEPNASDTVDNASDTVDTPSSSLYSQQENNRQMSTVPTSTMPSSTTPTWKGGWPKKTSCLRRQTLCTAHPECSKVLKAFKDACTVRKNQCEADDRTECTRRADELRPSGLFSCPCHHHTFKDGRCDKIKQKYKFHPCLVEKDPFIIGSGSHRPSLTGPTEVPFERGYTCTTEDNSKENMCIPMYDKCERDSSCRLPLARVIDACEWENGGCKRESCFPALNDFYIKVDPLLSRQMLFCCCTKGDERCQSKQMMLQPKCSLEINPEPSCLVQIEQCKGDSRCGARWNMYNDTCRFDNDGKCLANTSDCREAFVAIQGYDLTTRCSCRSHRHDNLQKCRYLQRVIHANPCTALSIHKFDNVTPKSTISDQPPKTDSPNFVSKPTCFTNKSQTAYPVPKYFEETSILRIDNSTDVLCPTLCTCTGSMKRDIACRVLTPCLRRQSCSKNGIMFTHGSKLPETQSHRGKCRCLHGEIICSNPTKTTDAATDSIILNLGYSTKEKSLLKDNSVDFDTENLTQKLTLLLNGRRRKLQNCQLTVLEETHGNIVYGVHSRKGASEIDCLEPTKMLNLLIDQSHNSVTNDAHLSIFKVSHYVDGTVKTSANVDSQSSSSGAKQIFHNQTKTISTIILITVTLFRLYGLPVG
ncbi:unnamed protein product [Owenia fusiformis]|uniref:Uncharacterized protein n=1 Tax=Owenia fusiformis TaxID=6347 RepID=A0A8J1UDN5_OWEFU|nr:unnamed protein product [Owenia fusiformis]